MYIYCTQRRDEMNRQKQIKVEPLALTVQEAMIRYRRGRNRMRDDAIAAEAVIRSGRRFLINIKRMDEYYLNLTGK